MKKFCVNCNKKQGVFSLNYKLVEGVICDDCISPFGLSSTQFNLEETSALIDSLKNHTAAGIVGAIRAENDVFTKIRSEVFSKVPAGVFFKFDGGLGEQSEDVFVYEDRAIILEKGFAGTSLGKKEITLLFKDIVSVSIDSPLLNKKDYMDFSLADGSTISIRYSGYKEDEAKKLKEFVESRIS